MVRIFIGYIDLSDNILQNFPACKPQGTRSF
jgi:hypothetical protein